MKYKKKLYSVFLASTALVLFLILVSSTASAAAQSASPAAAYAYVAFSDNNSITAIDTATDSVAATIPVGAYPVDVAVSPDGTRAYAVNCYGSSISAIDATTNKVIATIRGVLSPWGVAITPDGTKAYVTERNEGSNSVYVIDTATNNIVDTIHTGYTNLGVAVTPDGKKVYVASRNSVSVIDATNDNAITTISTTEKPFDVAVTPDGTKAYVTNYNSVSVIDTATDNITATIAPIGIGSYRITITPDGTRAYLSNFAGLAVDVIDLTTNTIIATIPAGQSPGRTVITSDETKAYVPTNIGGFPSGRGADQDNVFLVINTATNSVMSTVSVRNNPPTTNPVMITNTESSTPTINWTYHDAEGDPQQQYQIGVWTGQGGTETIVWAIAPKSMDTSIMYGGSPLSSGTTYYVRVKAFDGYNWGEWSETSFVSSFTQVIDTTFKPNPNGYQFENFKTPWPFLLSWETFRYTFGSELVDDNDIANKFYDMEYAEGIRDGCCFGMSASSLALYQNNYQSWDLGNNRDASVPNPKWGIFPNFVSTPADWTKYYQGRWLCPSVLEEVNSYSDKNAVYNAIKNHMSNGNWKNDPMVIVYAWWSDAYTDTNNNGQYDEGEPYQGNGNKIGENAHAVVPYKIWESPNGGSAKVFIYDSNHPDNDNLYFVFNLKQNTVFPLIDGNTGKYVGDNDNYFKINAISAVSLSSIKQKPDRIPSFEGVTSYAHILYTDVFGNRLGYLGKEYMNNILGAYKVWPTPGQGEVNDSSETYFIPEDMNLKREIIGLNDGIATVTAFKGNSLVTVAARVSPGSVDELNIPKDGSSVGFTSGKGTSILSLMLEKQETGVAQIVRADISQIEANGAIVLSNVDGTIVVQNHGLPRTCSLYLEQVGFSPNSDDSIKNIVIEGDSTIIVKPSDWNEIANSEIIIEHDVGSDGIVDSVETIRKKDATPPSSITNLQSTNGITWINWAWTNPTDSDFNHTEIYLNDIFQTNTSAEYFNATGLEPETEYTIGTRTVDISGNINETLVNSTVTTLAELASDTEKPVIESVVLYPANTTAGSTINVNVATTDNIDVTGVTASSIQLTKTDGFWQGSIIAPSSIGSYSLLITAKDAAGNIAETTKNYKVVAPTGSLGVGISPKTTTASTTGKTIDYTIKIKSIQNFDDVARVNVTMTGLPANYQVPLEWFNWNNQTVNVSSNSTISLPLRLTIPPGQSAGRKAFKVSANSTSWITTAFDSGVITIS